LVPFYVVLINITVHSWLIWAWLIVC